MQLNRRDMVTGLAASALLPFTSKGFAASSVEIGPHRIDVVSDGHLKLPASFLFDGLPENDLSAILARYDLTPDNVEPDCNITVFRDGERTVVFDVGAGPNFMESAGKLIEALDTIELDPSDVTHVLFTHGHPDHLWGLLDEFDDPLFPEAEYRMAQAEWEYWTDKRTVETIGEARQSFAAGAARLLGTIEDQTELFKPGEEVLPGIFARNTPGHTPGHTSFEVGSGTDKVMVVGDAIGNHHIAFEQPGWEVNSDQNAVLGAKSRLSLLDQLATEKMKMVGYHMPYPGIGYAEKKDGAYRFVSQ